MEDKMPVSIIGHGSPMNVEQDNIFTRSPAEVQEPFATTQVRRGHLGTLVDDRNVCHVIGTTAGISTN